MAKRLLALDLDGTTLNHAGELAPAVRDADVDEVMRAVLAGEN